MQFEVASRSDVGRVRTNNEDAFLVDREHGIYIVCDGMGGHQAGEVAAQLAAETVAASLIAATDKRGDPQTANSCAYLLRSLDLMRSAIGEAAKRVEAEAQAKPEQAGMGTTCTALWVLGESRVVIGHIGDSRAYLFRDGRATQLSDDHTYVGDLVSRGALHPDEADKHPHHNVLSRAIGVHGDVVAQVLPLSVFFNDCLLLCSDGLHHYFSKSSEMEGIVKHRTSNAAAGLDALVDKALDGGGHDNITGIYLRLLPPTQSETAAATRTLNVHPIVANLPERDRGALLALCEPLRLGPNEIVDNEAAQAVFFVLEGSVTHNTGERQTLVRAGEMCGLLTILAPGEPTTLQALEQTSLSRLTTAAFNYALTHLPSLGVGFLHRCLDHHTERKDGDGGPDIHS